MTPRWAGTAVLAAATIALGGCGSAGSGGFDGPTGSSASITGTVTVFAASSLKESFDIISRQFELDHPGVTVTVNYGPSSGLARQLTEGAPADVFAAASGTTMATVTDAGLATTPTVFAINTLAIATPPQPRVPVTSLAGLAGPGVKVAVCQQDVPCGVAAKALFAKNSLNLTPVTEEVDVKAVLSKVVLGEVDAGVVYATDVRAAKDSVVGVSIPAGANVSTSYPIAAMSAAPNPAAAAAFVAQVLSPTARNTLALAGFGSP